MSIRYNIVQNDHFWKIYHEIRPFWSEEGPLWFNFYENMEAA